MDAVNVGVLLLHADKHFDLRLSGINHGTNVGNFAHFSGTVGAAKEGRLLGIPSIAVSQSRQRTEFVTAARFVAQLIDQLKTSALPSSVFLTINWNHAATREQLKSWELQVPKVE